MPFCSRCGAEVGEGDPFCGKCGAKLAQVVSQPVAPPTVGSSGLAVAALVLGILGFPFVFASIGAIICGILDVKETGVGRLRGRGLAIAGLVLGCVVLVGWLITFRIGVIFWHWRPRMDVM